MTTLAEMRKQREQRVENLTKKLTANAKPTFEKEEEQNVWKLTLDATGAGSAVIRFLPGLIDEEEYYTTHNYSFQDSATGRYYIEKSLSTIGQLDPCAERNSALWKQGDKSQTAEGRGRKTDNWANIFVVKDPGNPDAEGQNFKFKFGKQVFGFIKDAQTPTDADEVAFNPFDIEEGANFRLKSTPKEAMINGKKVTFPNYEKSKFETCAPLFKTDAEMEVVLNNQHSLKHLVDPEKFKTYDELKRRLDFVTGKGDNQAVDEAADIPFVPDEPKASKRINTKIVADEPEEDGDLAWLKDLNVDD